MFQLNANIHASRPAFTDTHRTLNNWEHDILIKITGNPSYLLSYPKLNRFPNCSFENEMFHEKHQAFIVNMIIRCLLIKREALFSFNV